MTFAQLRVLRAVARTGNLTRAAEELGTTQSAVSHALRLLERELGVSLFVRGSQGVTPTPAGRAVDRRAALILAEVEAIAEEAAAARGEACGRLRVGVIPSANARLMPRVLRAFAAAHPDAALTVLEGSDEEVLGWLTTGAVDVATLGTATVDVATLGTPTADVATLGTPTVNVATLGTPTADVATLGTPTADAATLGTATAGEAVETVETGQAVEVVPLARDRLLAVLPAGHRLAVRPRVTVAEVARHPFIMSSGGCEPLITALAARADVALRCHYRVRDIGSILAMVAEDLGVSIIPELALPARADGVRVVPLDPDETRTIRLGLPCGALPLAVAFAEAALAEVPPAYRP